MAEEDKKTESTEAKAEEAKEEPKTPAQEDKPKEAKSDKEVPAKFKKLVEEVEKMSVLELSELVKVLEDRFGVSAAPAMVAGVAPAAGGGEAEAVEEGKKEFTIVLKDAGASKIEVIKAVREISGLGLAESKAVVDGAPKNVKENVPKDEAEEAKGKLEAAGATVELT